MHTDASSRRTWLFLFGLAVITFLAYTPLLTNGFINFDDNIYIYKNRWVQLGLTDDSIAWAFSFDDKEGTYWQPLTWLFLMLNHELFGLNPVGYHLVNLLMHLASAFLLYSALNRMTGSFGRSAFVAALFALHPLDVESVAWATEQKSIISTLFFMLCLTTYARYAESPSRLRYLAICGFLAAGLMAKSMLVSLPALLLLLDIWPLRRIGTNGTSLLPWRLVSEKLPLLGISLLSVGISIFSVSSMYATETPDQPGLAGKISEALVSYLLYLGKLFWPVDLIIFYPSRMEYPVWQVAGAALLLGAVSGIAVWQVKQRPWLLAGWFWYLGTLFPVAGLVRSGLWPAMADRFTYIPQIGIFIIVAWGGAELLERLLPHRIVVMRSAAILILIPLAVVTRVQAGYWQDSETLFSHVLKVMPDNYIGHANLADHLFYGGKVQESLSHYQEAVRVRPERAKARQNLGAALGMLERYDEAIVQYREAIRLEPKLAEAHYGLGVSYGPKGELAKAVEHLETAVKLDPVNPTYRTDLARAFYLQGNRERAAQELQAARGIEAAGSILR